MASRFAAAGGLEGRVEREDDEACLGERLAVHRPGGLFFAAADRVGADDGRVLLRRVEARREVDVRGDIDVLVLESDGFHG
ncbi:hypothetical protein [Streptomyces sp. NPDC050564]|uniref:hypothetical protein n=1 Tax=Streptomyces sp. NPDC050564 TaxID=3365631 RepID=UPI0037A974EB